MIENFFNDEPVAQELRAESAEMNILLHSMHERLLSVLTSLEEKVLLLIGVYGTSDIQICSDYSMNPDDVLRSLSLLLQKGLVVRLDRHFFALSDEGEVVQNQLLAQKKWRLQKKTICQ